MHKIQHNQHLVLLYYIYELGWPMWALSISQSWQLSPCLGWISLCILCHQLVVPTGNGQPNGPPLPPLPPLPLPPSPVVGGATRCPKKDDDFMRFYPLLHWHLVHLQACHQGSEQVPWVPRLLPARVSQQLYQTVVDASSLGLLRLLVTRFTTFPGGKVVLKFN